MAKQALTLETQVEVREPCEACGGTGYIVTQAFCQECGHKYSQEEVEKILTDLELWAHDYGAHVPAMPCGDLAYDLDDGRNDCVPCDANGHTSRHVALGELVTFLGSALAQRVACEHARPTFITTRK